MANKQNRMSGNKGEWSELYTFLRLLSQGRVHAANDKVEKIDEVYYPIVSIDREETKGNRIDYVIYDDKIYFHEAFVTFVRKLGKKNYSTNMLNHSAPHSRVFRHELLT